ncbi:MAG: hypothetical protein JF615_13940 [Asticcacaulis sp.]|nr:hypothetical protein [Asticcacaulis sp.]
MGKLSISLDEQAENWLHEQAGEDVSAYVNTLIHKDQERKAAEAELCRMIDKAVASGISPRTPQEIMEDVRTRMQADGRL